MAHPPLLALPGPPMVDQNPHRPLAGVFARLGAVVALAVMFALVKLVTARGVGIVEAVFFRQLFALPVIGVWIALGPGKAALRTARPGAHVVRMALGLTAMALNFWGYSLLPLAEATVIGFTVPVFGTALAALLLREPTGVHRWSAVAVGFAGVLIVVQPGTAWGGGFLHPLGTAVALAGALMTAAVTIQIRQLGRTEGTATTVLWFTMSSLAPLAVLMLWQGQAHEAGTWGLLLAIGLAGGLGQLGLTAALRFAPVSVVLPMDYTMLLWATILGAALFDSWPGTSTWIGAPVIVASGLYIVWRERVRSRAVATG